MLKGWRNTSVAWGAISIAGAALLALAIQYPMATTWPMGGDAASYITKSIRILDAPNLGQAAAELAHSRYPATQLLLTASAPLPLSWPDRFVWLMTLGHIMAGVALAWLVWRLTRRPLAAAAALFFWAVSTTSIQHHFEDATLAQLWSVPGLLFWLESLYARAWKRNALFLMVTAATHPFSGFLATLISLLFLSQVVRERNHEPSTKVFLKIFASLTLLSTLLISSVLIIRPTIIRSSADQVVLGELVRSVQGGLFLLAPIGGLLILHRQRHHVHEAAVTIAWLIATVFLAFNDRFHIGVETNRFLTYLYVLAATGAAVAVPEVFARAIPPRLLRALILTALAGAVFLWSWNGSAVVYTFYESPSRYARLHRDEQAAFLALARLLPADSVVVSSEANRHAEWLPILTQRSWVAVPQSDPLWRGQARDWQAYAAQHHYTHLVVLEHTEEAPEPMRAADNPFPVVYANESVTVYRLL